MTGRAVQIITDIPGFHRHGLRRQNRPHAALVPVLYTVSPDFTAVSEGIVDKSGTKIIPGIHRTY
jgi:hypothetical protein